MCRITTSEKEACSLKIATTLLANQPFKLLTESPVQHKNQFQSETVQSDLILFSSRCFSIFTHVHPGVPRWQEIAELPCSQQSIQSVGHRLITYWGSDRAIQQQQQHQSDIMKVTTSIITLLFASCGAADVQRVLEDVVSGGLVYFLMCIG